MGRFTVFPIDFSISVVFIVEGKVIHILINKIQTYIRKKLFKLLPMCGNIKTRNFRTCVLKTERRDYI